MNDRLQEIKAVLAAVDDWRQNFPREAIKKYGIEWFRWLIAEVERLRVENARLREALELIVNNEGGWDNQICQQRYPDNQRAWCPGCIAASALAATGDDE